jgi:hypothetical protein
MPHVADGGNGGAGPQDPNTFDCKWSSCKGEHLEKLKSVKAPNLENYPNDGKVTKGGYRDDWIAAKMCPWGKDPPPASYQLARYGRLLHCGKRVNANTYYFEAHHLIPSTLLKQMGTLKDNLILIGYKVDDKNNGLILPGQHMDQPIHKLPRHKGNHPGAYMDPIKKRLDQIEKYYDGICKNDAAGNLKPQAAVIKVLDNLSQRAESMILNIRKKNAKCWPLRSDARAEFKEAEEAYQRRIERYEQREKEGKN